MGRQPWVVFGLMTTANGVSPECRHRRGLVATSLIRSPSCTARSPSSRSDLIKTIRQGLPDVTASTPPDDDDADRPLAFAY